LKFGPLDFPRRLGPVSPLITAGLSVGAAAMEAMEAQATDTTGLPRRYRTWLALTGLTAHQFRNVLTLIGHKAGPPTRGRPWSMPLPVRVLLLLIHLRTNLTTPALAALFNTSQSTVDRVIAHLVPVLANAIGPDIHDSGGGPWIIDGTLIPVHDQSITAISKNYRRSVNTHIVVNAKRRTVITVGRCWPGNRHDVVVARDTVAPLLAGRVVSATAATVA
jgi:hypothetical protein